MMQIVILIVPYLPFGTNVLFKEGNIGKKQCNQGKSKSYLSFDINICEINSVFDNFHIPPNFLKWNATTKNRIPKSKFVVNTHILSFGFGSVKGTIIPAPNHPAERFTNKSESIESQYGSKLYIRSLYQRVVDWVNEAYLPFGASRYFDKEIVE